MLRETCFSATLSTTNPRLTWALPVTNHLSHGTAKTGVILLSNVYTYHHWSAKLQTFTPLVTPNPETFG
jgi:hypothetical protein